MPNQITINYFFILFLVFLLVSISKSRATDTGTVSLVLSLFMDISNWLRLHDVWVRFFYVRWRYLPQVIWYLLLTIHYTLVFVLRGIYDSYLIEQLPDPTNITVAPLN